MGRGRTLALAALVGAGCASVDPPVPPAPVVPVTAAVGRAGLEIPEDLWEAAAAGLDRPGATIGYSSDAMAFYTGGRKHLLPAVENLFRDARALPRYSGSLADKLIAAAPKPDEVVQIAYSLTDAVAGRMLPIPDLKEGWGIEGVAKDAPVEDVLVRFGGEAYSTDGGNGMLNLAIGLRPSTVENLRTLPPEVLRLIARIEVAAAEARPWVEKSVEGVSIPSNEKRYAFATAALVDERLGQMASRNHESFRALASLDRNYLAFGSVLFLARIEQALDEYRAAEKHPVPEGFTTVAMGTKFGTFRVYGPGDDEITGEAAMVLDLGGNDRWSMTHDEGDLLGLAIDLGGDDTFDGGDEPAAVACGLFGIGALFDLGGNDTYKCKESGLGCGWFGTGVLFDAAGNDVYETGTHWGQGCGYAGVGALIDLAGDDRYVIGYEGQGYGATLGAGILLDVAGNDTYLARDDGNKSDLYNGQTVSMAQGVGQGRRADLGDGHSMAGGFGVLVDGAGNDSYHAGAWSHGAGYWWACGILEDLGGNDTYYDGKYSLGAAAHFAVGVQVDLAGDDAYNVGNATAVNQYQGHARDGSIGVSVDGDGNDRYLLRSHCGGSADLDSIGVLYDRRGDDVYEIGAVRTGEGEGWPETPPLGTSTRYDPARSFRDDLDTLGIFLDGGGKDDYRGEPGPWGNGKTWPCRRGPRFLGVGIDRD